MGIHRKRPNARGFETPKQIMDCVYEAYADIQEEFQNSEETDQQELKAFFNGLQDEIGDLLFGEDKEAFKEQMNFLDSEDYQKIANAIVQEEIIIFDLSESVGTTHVECVSFSLELRGGVDLVSHDASNGLLHVLHPLGHLEVPHVVHLLDEGIVLLPERHSALVYPVMKQNYFLSELRAYTIITPATVRVSDLAVLLKQPRVARIRAV